MRQFFVIVRDNQESHRLDITNRDWGLLFGPYFEEGRRFIDALGVYEHFTVARGVPEGSQVTRKRFLLIEATQNLLRAVQRDEELLRYNYSFAFSAGDGSRAAGAQAGFKVRGLNGHIDARPHGYCHLRLSQFGSNGTPRMVEFIDMRVRGSIETEDLGVLKIHRRKAEMYWLETLPPLLEFLRARNARAVTVEHHEERV